MIYSNKTNIFKQLDKILEGIEQGTGFGNKTNEEIKKLFIDLFTEIDKAFPDIGEPKPNMTEEEIQWTIGYNQARKNILKILN